MNSKKDMHIKSILDKIYIIPSIQEKWSILNENKPSRPFVKINDNKIISVNLKKKMNYHYSILSKKNTCLCTWNDSLDYSFYNKLNKTPEQIWINIANIINSLNNKLNTNNNKNYFIVSHHNILKKNILKFLINNDYKSIANCSTFIIKYEENNWVIKLIFEGFPDKKKYKYHKLSSRETYKIDKLFNNNTFIIDKKTKIFLIRHANAYHNLPLKLTKGFFKRTIDSNLTPLGIYQSRILGLFLKNNYINKSDKNIYFSSYLNRAQHTTLEIMHSLEDKNKYTNLFKLEYFYTKFSVLRLIRKLKKKKNQKLEQLINNLVNTLSDYNRNIFIELNKELYNIILRSDYDLISYNLNKNVSDFMKIPKNFIFT